MCSTIKISTKLSKELPQLTHALQSFIEAYLSTSEKESEACPLEQMRVCLSPGRFILCYHFLEMITSSTDPLLRPGSNSSTWKTLGGQPLLEWVAWGSTHPNIYSTTTRFLHSLLTLTREKKVTDCHRICSPDSPVTVTKERVLGIRSYKGDIRGIIPFYCRETLTTSSPPPRDQYSFPCPRLAGSKDIAPVRDRFQIT